MLFGFGLRVAKGPSATEVHKQDDSGEEGDTTDDGVVKLGQESPVASLLRRSSGEILGQVEQRSVADTSAVKLLLERLEELVASVPDEVGKCGCKTSRNAAGVGVGAEGVQACIAVRIFGEGSGPVPVDRCGGDSIDIASISEGVCPSSGIACLDGSEKRLSSWIAASAWACLSAHDSIDGSGILVSEPILAIESAANLGVDDLPNIQGKDSDTSNEEDEADDKGRDHQESCAAAARAS